MDLGNLLERMFGDNETKDNEETEPEAGEKQPQMTQQQVTDDENVKKQESVAVIDEEQHQGDNTLFNRSSKALVEDKTCLNLALAVEQAIMAKQVSDQNVEELKDRLQDSQKQNEIIRRDLGRVRALLAEKEKQIDDLKDKVTEKNMQIDQALEQYRQMESEMTETVDELKNRLDIEQRKYQQLSQEAQNQQQEALREIKQRDSTIHELQGHKANLKQQLQEVKEQNSYLMNIVRDFTDQVSGSFARAAGGTDVQKQSNDEEPKEKSEQT